MKVWIARMEEHPTNSQEDWYYMSAEVDLALLRDLVMEIGRRGDAGERAPRTTAPRALTLVIEVRARRESQAAYGDRNADHLRAGELFHAIELAGLHGRDPASIAEEDLAAVLLCLPPRLIG